MLLPKKCCKCVHLVIAELSNSTPGQNNKTDNRKKKTVAALLTFSQTCTQY